MQKEPWIIGFSDALHDRSVCLLKGDELVVAIEEERITRKKHGLYIYDGIRNDPELFSKMNIESDPICQTEPGLIKCIDYCLKEAGISLNNVDIIIGNSLHDAKPLNKKAIYINHHIAHAASSYYTSGFQSSAILVLDGYGDLMGPNTFEAALMAVGIDEKIEVINSIHGKVSKYYDMQNSCGVFYRIGTILSGFGILDEGKMMGLSAYGQPKYSDQIESFIKMNQDNIEIDNGLLWLELKYLMDKKLEFIERADIASSFQYVLQKMILHYVNILYKVTNNKNLCLAGGVALNCVANNYVRENSKFDNIFISPAPGDNGISIGAAYYAAYKILKLPRKNIYPPNYLGKTYTNDEISLAIASVEDAIIVKSLKYDDLVQLVVNLLLKDQIIMFYQQNSEFGPRALGNRSILANPQRVEIRDYINKYVKHRELFRPLAPIVLEEKVKDFFCYDTKSPYMLFSPMVKEITKTIAPAIVHVDGSSRLQTVTKVTNLLVYDIITNFYNKTGCPIILNTSFNKKDEPIVETPKEALDVFLNSPVQHLFIGNFYITRR